jgi:DNA-binding MarR family transcriptional regulator
VRLAINQLPPRVRNSIAIEIMLLLAFSAEKCCKLTVKTLFAELTYSTMAVRSHFRMLLENGYIDTEQHENDGRVKYVRITERGQLIVEQYLEHVCQFIDEYDLTPSAEKN